MSRQWSIDINGALDPDASDADNWTSSEDDDWGEINSSSSPRMPNTVHDSEVYAESLYEQHAQDRLKLRSQPPSLWLDSHSDNDLGSSNISEGLKDGSDSEPQTIPEFDWDYYLYNEQILPSSNWEADFLKHKSDIMSRYSYKGLINYDINLKLASDMEEVAFTGESEEPTLTRLCYGMIHNVRVKLLPQAVELVKGLQTTMANLASPSMVQSTQDFYVFDVCWCANGKSFLLKPPKIEGGVHPLESIAVLNQESYKVLSQIASVCTFAAYSPVETWTLVLNTTSKFDNPALILVDVVVYGTEDCLEEIGSILDAHRVFLQEPDYRDASLAYQNPHFMDLTPVRERSVDLSPSNTAQALEDIISIRPQASAEQVMNSSILKQTIAAVFKTTTRARNLGRIAADVKVHTPLLGYQEEALDFITQRETGRIPEEYCLWKPRDSTSYTHVITGCQKDEKTIEAGGGILADEMGLGKTLTMLSAIIGTADKAKVFERKSQLDADLIKEHISISSRATLVIVPNRLIINEWRQEIKMHCTGLTEPVVYHGHGRQGDPKMLAESDIVLSTYHTISTELADQTSPLWQVNWYRIILDEAHWIRCMDTKLFVAVNKLRSHLRWCLTGTPIQNSLEDLAALVNFIQCHPLDDLHMFKKHIISPLMKQSENGVENLRLLLDSVCLRRTNELLDLPDVITEVRILALSAREKKQYIDTRNNFINITKKQRLNPQRKGNLGIFQLLLQLRRLCNHGTFQRPTLGVEEFDPEQAMSHLKTQQNAKCEACDTAVTGIHGIEERRNGSFTTNESDGCPRCSICLETISGEYLQTTAEAAPSSLGKNQSKWLSPWQYFNKNGCSTKISAVVLDIEEHKTEGKSIVFSCWTKSLDLVGIFLNSRSIDFVRIDGSHSFGQRKLILETYQNDPRVKILLMTTGTGAVGLNLTVANCIYILEPQWNPMVESQAIARVNRLGQKRNVRVVRYIMKGTVEEVELQAQQIRKLEYAKVGWEKE
ncbi:DNA repair protein [Lachnellula occidentalis]|uniref:DNA repair protein n=1 Tax=Lachnellula occidentalis TaxID=215460 RepID=A0A8H8UHF1_9HELO|nr:DNA repair protein [Lachnellula occidentalis]